MRRLPASLPKRAVSRLRMKPCTRRHLLASGSAGSDRPDRLISDDQVGRGRRVRQRAVELAADHVQRLPASRSAALLADADDGHEPCPVGGHAPWRAPAHRSRDGRRAPLGMTDNDGVGAGIGQLFSRDIAGMGAGGLGVAILRADRHRRAARGAAANSASNVDGGHHIRSHWRRRCPR